jgi:hypothetical protein
MTFKAHSNAWSFGTDVGLARLKNIAPIECYGICAPRLGASFQRAPPNEPTNKRLKALLFGQTMTTITCNHHA